MCVDNRSLWMKEIYCLLQTGLILMHVCTRGHWHSAELCWAGSPIYLLHSSSHFVKDFYIDLFVIDLSGRQIQITWCGEDIYGIYCPQLPVWELKRQQKWFENQLKMQQKGQMVWKTQTKEITQPHCFSIYLILSS